MSVSATYMHYNASSCNPGINRPVAFVVVAQQPIDEAGGRFERRLGCVPVWRVASLGQNNRLYRAVALFLHRRDLPERTVFVVGTLHNQDRNPDVAERFGNIPLLKSRIEPRSCP